MKITQDILFLKYVVQLTGLAGGSPLQATLSREFNESNMYFSKIRFSDGRDRPPSVRLAARQAAGLIVLESFYLHLRLHRTSGILEERSVMARRGEMRARKPMSEQETEICHRRSRRRGRLSYGRRSLRAWFGLGPSAQTMMTEIQFSDRVSCALFLSRPDTKMVGQFWKPSHHKSSFREQEKPKRQSCKVAGRASLSSLTLCLCFYQITDPQLVSRRRHRSTAAAASAMSLVSKTLPPSLPLPPPLPTWIPRPPSNARYEPHAGHPT